MGGGITSASRAEKRRVGPRAWGLVAGEEGEGGGGSGVGGAETGGEGRDHETAQEAQASGPEVVVVAVPDVAHRRVAVAEVPGPRMRADPLFHPMRAPDDQVE